MRRAGSTPEELLAGLDGWHLEKVEALRDLVLRTAPQLEESVRGGILYYEDGGDLFAIAAQKRHVALYVLAPSAMEESRDLLAGLDCGKGCIRFGARTEVPEAAIGTLLERAAASSERDCD